MLTLLDTPGKPWFVVVVTNIVPFVVVLPFLVGIGIGMLRGTHNGCQNRL